MALPNLSDADRQKALKKAAEARQKRAELRAEIKSGKLSFAAVMKKSGDPVVARMKVSTLLESLPYIRMFSGATMGIKYGGAAMSSADLKDEFATDIALLWRPGLAAYAVLLLA